MFETEVRRCSHHQTGRHISTRQCSQPYTRQNLHCALSPKRPASTTSKNGSVLRTALDILTSETNPCRDECGSSVTSMTHSFDISAWPIAGIAALNSAGLKSLDLQPQLATYLTPSHHQPSFAFAMSPLSILLPGGSQASNGIQDRLHSKMVEGIMRDTDSGSPTTLFVCGASETQYRTRHPSAKPRQGIQARMNHPPAKYN